MVMDSGVVRGCVRGYVVAASGIARGGIGGDAAAMSEVRTHEHTAIHEARVHTVINGVWPK